MQPERNEKSRRHHLDRRAHGILSGIADAPNDRLLNSNELAAWFGVSPAWVETARRNGVGPPFVRLSRKAIRYKVADVRKWLQERRRENYHAERERRGGPVAGKVRRTR